jgi:hypothetical protein
VEPDLSCRFGSFSNHPIVKPTRWTSREGSIISGKPFTNGVRGLIVCAALIICGCRVSKPGEVEGKIAKEVKHKVTVGGKDVPNPLPDTEENIAEGREHFGHHCGICHGLDGQSAEYPSRTR